MVEFYADNVALSLSSNPMLQTSCFGNNNEIKLETE